MRTAEEHIGIMRDMQVRGRPIRSISAVLPLRGQTPNIEAFVEATIEALGDAVPDFELLIVDAGTTGEGGRVADALARAYPPVRPLRPVHSAGYGTAVRTGIAEATRQFILLLAPDRGYDPLQIERFVQWGDRYDAVVGHRQRGNDALRRRIARVASRLLIRALFGLRLTDPTCGFMLCRASILADLPLRSKGSALPVEIQYRLRQWQATMHAVPVTCRTTPRARPWAAIRAGANATLDVLALTRHIRAERRTREHGAAERLGPPEAEQESDATAGMP